MPELNGKVAAQKAVILRNLLIKEISLYADKIHMQSALVAPQEFEDWPGDDLEEIRDRLRDMLRTLGSKV
jgi:hypothetical protein